MNFFCLPNSAKKSRLINLACCKSQLNSFISFYFISIHLISFCCSLLCVHSDYKAVKTVKRLLESAYQVRHIGTTWRPSQQKYNRKWKGNLLHSNLNTNSNPNRNRNPLNRLLDVLTLFKMLSSLRVWTDLEVYKYKEAMEKPPSKCQSLRVFWKLDEKIAIIIFICCFFRLLPFLSFFLQPF